MKLIKLYEKDVFGNIDISINSLPMLIYLSDLSQLKPDWFSEKLGSIKKFIASSDEATKLNVIQLIIIFFHKYIYNL